MMTARIKKCITKDDNAAKYDNADNETTNNNGKNTW